MIGGKPKELDLRVLMTRPSSYDHREHFHLRIKDDASNLIILDVVMDLEAFADLHSSTHATMTGAFYNDERIGKTHENKSVFIELGASLGRSSNIKKLNKEVDKWEAKNAGWTVDRDERWNSHRWDYNAKTYKVIARRWV